MKQLGHFPYGKEFFPVHASIPPRERVLLQFAPKATGKPPGRGSPAGASSTELSYIIKSTIEIESRPFSHSVPLGWDIQYAAKEKTVLSRF